MKRLLTQICRPKQAFSRSAVLRVLKGGCAVLLLTVGLQSARGFALVGPKEGFQTSVLGYTRLSEIIYPGGDVWSILTAPEWQFAPRNLAEEFRWSVPTLYYTYDPAFLDYFGSNGVRAVDQAVGILNALTNVDSYSTALSEFPLDELRFNHTASALHLFDLKSAALEMLVTDLGLADSERWTWCLRARTLPPGAQCPAFDYDVIQRNFDPATWAPSKYVNGNLFTYQIQEICPPGFDRDDPVEVLVDPSDTYQTAVSASKITYPNILYYGAFHTGLTRDDVGGLRYLYTSLNRNVESAPSDSTLFQTNNNSFQLLFTSNLTALAQASLTNDAVTLATLFPGLIITSTSNSFLQVPLTNFSAYFTNFPWDPVGTFPHLVFTTITNNFNFQTIFHHTFANIGVLQPTANGFTVVQPGNIFQFTNHSILTLQTISATNGSPWSSGLTINTNVSSRSFTGNGVVGEFFILPTNSCDVAIVGVAGTHVVFETNVLVSATNSATVTNITLVQLFTQNLIDTFTQHALFIHPIECQTNSFALREGLQKISFVRHDFDSLLNRFFAPITNDYTMVAVTNSQTVVQRFRRIVTRPDIVFSAADIGPNGIPVEVVDRNGDAPNFVTVTNGNGSNSLTGTLEGPIRFTFNKVGPVRLNTGPFLVDEAVSILYFIWGSFDGSTNAPYIYGGDTANDIQNQLVIMVSPGSIPDGTVGTPYNVPVSVAGGQAPYDWTMTPGSPALPPGLNLTQDPGDSSLAAISGTPAVAGSYQFWIRVTDAGGRFVDQVYVLLISP